MSVDACAAGRTLLDYCEKFDIDPTNATLEKMPKYMGTRGTTHGVDIKDEIWCLVWAETYDYEEYGPSDKEKPTRIFIDEHTEWNWKNCIHRDKGPAVTTKSGEKRYFKHGQETDAEGQILPENT